MGLEYREKKAITTEGESPERQQLLLVEQAVPRLVLPLIVLCSRQVFRCASQPSPRQCLRLLGFNMFKDPNQTQIATNKQKNKQKKHSAILIDQSIAQLSSERFRPANDESRPRDPQQTIR